MDRIKTVMTWTAGAALTSAAFLNVLGVLGRHSGIPFKGSIELVQPAVLIAGSLALIAATGARSHARVHVMLDRLGEGFRHGADKAGIVLSILFFAALLAGSSWVAIDLWTSQEVSEVIGVPWRWMRLGLNFALAAVIVILIRQLFERRR